MSQGNADYNSSRGPSQKIENFYDVGSRLTADACGAGGEVMRGYYLAPLPANLPLIPSHLPLWSVPLSIGRPHNVDAPATPCFRSVGREDGKSYAVKVILLEKTREDKSQIKTLGEVNHPGIIKLVDWFETPST
jgi:hypothetical protein